MKIIHKALWERTDTEKISQVDNVDRSAFVPLSIQFERMRLAGLQLENLKAYQYNTDLQDFLASGKSISDYTDEVLLKKAFIDKTVADDMIKSKMEKYQKARRTQDLLKEYQAYSKQFEREKELQQQAVLNYKKELESKKENS